MINTNVQKHFDDLARQGVWANLYTDSNGKVNAETWSFLVRVQYVMGLIAQYAGSGPVLDVGCGTAPIARAICAMGREYAGIDFAESMVKAAQESHSDLGARFKVSVGDATRIDAPDGSYGAVVAMGVFEYLTVDLIRQALAEIRRVLQPEGCAIITIPKRHSWPKAMYSALYPVRKAIGWRPSKRPTKLELQEEFQRLYMMPGELQKFCEEAGMKEIAGQHYNAQFISRPFTVMAPRACYLLNRPFETCLGVPGLGFLGTGFIGVYRPN
ncbi:MAG: methyltransferase domain-containing protein [Planctomycetaceae bacterium]